jgi:dTDP-4-dehydrorhamnose reductase
MKKILISGGNGKLATCIKKCNKEYELITPSAEEMNICNFNQVDEFIYKNKPDMFLHTAALTKPMVLHENKPEKSIRINIIGTSNVVLACMKYNVKLINISTDYVYEGTDGDYKETCPLKPFNKYGWSKLGGECAVQLYENSLTLRIAMMNKPFPYNKALVDVKRSVLFEDYVANLIFDVIDEYGIVNIGGKGQSIYEFAKAHNSNVEAMYLSDVKDVTMPSDITLNLDKLNDIIENK